MFAVLYRPRQTRTTTSGGHTGTISLLRTNSRSLVVLPKMTGAGVRRGLVHGASDKDSAYPASDPVSSQAIIATIYAALGIDVASTIPDISGQPQPIAQHGRPIRAILA